MKQIPDLSKCNSWHGFKVEPGAVAYVSPHKTKKLILYNIAFWNSINDYQRYFCLQWSRFARKRKDVNYADEKAKRDYIACGFDFDHILKMYAQMAHVNNDVKAGRMYHLLTEKVTVKEKLIRFWQIINAWLKKIFQKGK